MQFFVAWPADQRSVIPPSLISEFRNCTCSRCHADLVCHEPTRKRHWDGWEVVCPDCAAKISEAVSDPYVVLQERDKAFERHWHRG